MEFFQLEGHVVVPDLNAWLFGIFSFQCWPKASHAEHEKEGIQYSEAASVRRIVKSRLVPNIALPFIGNPPTLIFIQQFLYKMMRT